jgi:7-cyano-7-deazaguanine tRNA-ribosyltransferase
MEHPSKLQLRKLVGVGNYQFGNRVGSALFKKNVTIECSRRTGRIRHIYLRGNLIATLRPKDGFLALTLDGARIILSLIKKAPNLVVVDASVSEAIRSGGDVFAKHVVRADPNLRPGEEVIVIDSKGDLLGVGAAVLAGREMASFKRGVAVNLRKGSDEVAGAMTGASRAQQRPKSQ